MIRNWCATFHSTKYVFALLIPKIPLNDLILWLSSTFNLPSIVLQWWCNIYGVKMYIIYGQSPFNCNVMQDITGIDDESCKKYLIKNYSYVSVTKFIFENSATNRNYCYIRMKRIRITIKFRRIMQCSFFLQTTPTSF